MPIPRLGKDDNREPVQLTPAVVALEETTDTSVSSTTEITLNAATTFIEVNALNQGIFMKWGTSDASSTDYDEFILPNSVRHYVVPNQSDGTPYTAVNFIEQAASATLILIEK